MVERSQVEAVESSLLADDAHLAAAHAAAVREGRATLQAVVDRHDVRLAHDGSLDAAAFDAEVEAVQRAALDAYAREVAGGIPAEQTQRWREMVDALAAASPQRATLLAVGAPGAASLLAALDPAATQDAAGAPPVSLDAALAPVAARCTCGFAATRAMPRQPCWHCDAAIAESWLVEEHRLLQRIPALSAAHAAVFDALLDRLADLWAEPDDTTADGARRLRGEARRPIARANAAHAGEIERVGDAEWRRLAALAEHSSRTEVRMTARRWSSTGLGMARMAQLGHEHSPEVSDRIAQRTLDGTIGSTRSQPLAWVRRLLGRDA